MKELASTASRYAIPNYFTNRVIRPYLANVRNWQCHVQFLGLPDRRDNPDILIDRLFVTPLLVRRYVSPDENPNNWSYEAETLLDALAENSPLVLLGDPGIGKSTFLNYVAWLLSRPAENALIDRMGWRLPLPMVLRELPVGRVTDFDGLLKAFLGREMSAPLREDGGSYVRQALAKGKAFLLLDGIDELGDRTARENLRSAVFDGMVRYPNCRWLLTSRIVGYDEVPFDPAHSRRDEPPFPAEPDGELRDTITHGRPREFLTVRKPRGPLPVKPEFRGGQLPIRYIAPFDDRRIVAFARNWYTRREASTSRASANADHLVRAVHADESILRLARVPNLLTMMALIHRIEATLPHGRALLYERIAEAYLESIDKFRGIESSPHDLPRKKGWLARVGFEMQRRRMEEGHPDGTSILMDAETVREWLSEEMRRSDADPDTPSAEEFLNVTGRRSGLFLPRGEGRYSFVHLSFQEYFAAFALKREVTRLQWAKGNASRLGFDRNTLTGWAGQSLWRETFAFLFELLASAEDDDWHADLLDSVFGENFAKLVGSNSEGVALNLGHLLARLIVNSRSGLTPPKRMEAIESCVKVEFEHLSYYLKESSGIFSILVGDDAQLNAETFKQIEIQLEKAEPRKRLLDFRRVQLSDFGPLSSLRALRQLDLDEAGISDLRPLSSLLALESLFLSGTEVSDLRPLSNLFALETLFLGMTKVSDLGPLSNLRVLETLYLSGTQVSDLGPLSSLVTLESLHLDTTQVSGLGPLSSLAALESLHLYRTQVSDVGPLSSLRALRWLDLDGTRVSDVGPLSSLHSLRTLYLNGTGVTDLGPLSGLHALEMLYLDGTGVTDLGPLSRLAALESLNLNGTLVSDLTPLTNLAALKTLYLDGTGVSDLGPVVKLRALETLHLRETQVPRGAIEDLRTRRPELTVYS